ncbi:expressed unknown protein [Seminavis robusta]|uniref:Uncharacterized protein n=1 Tax=Seminavis robusta TaxID=568900 RepID=A0A9N8DLH7_9STRA|nr:expressed unknown protein [Seminavis robusta]|eukprot:Sro197_g083940.1 n/a (513) ;mRNA; r:90060-91598
MDPPVSYHRSVRGNYCKEEEEDVFPKRNGVKSSGNLHPDKFRSLLIIMVVLLVVVYVVKVPVVPTCPDLRTIDVYKNSSSEDSVKDAVNKESIAASESSLPTNEDSSLPLQKKLAVGNQQPQHVASCTWAPSKTDPFNKQGAAYRDSTCTKLLQERIRASSVDYDPATSTTTTTPRRWILIGGSTMGNLFLRSTTLKKKLSTAKQIQAHYYCPSVLMCHNRTHQRCHLNQAYMYPPLHSDQWNPPNYTLGEGPIWARNHPNCQDVSRIFSEFVLCQRRQYVPTSQCNNNNNNNNNLLWTQNENNKQLLYYGGFFSIDFARDVEVQTHKYGTSQENLVAFLQDHYMADPWIRETFGGPPVCIISLGSHDMGIPNIALKTFLVNAEWFLSLLLIPGFLDDKQKKADTALDNKTLFPVCSHVILLHNTAPLQKNDTSNSLYHSKNTVERTRAWNRATEDLVQNSKILPKHRMTIVDVFAASKRYPHRDNMHLKSSWYNALGAFFAQVMDTVTAAV